jgi:hypothetical protein
VAHLPRPHRPKPVTTEGLTHGSSCSSPAHICALVLQKPASQVPEGHHGAWFPEPPEKVAVQRWEMKMSFRSIPPILFSLCGVIYCLLIHKLYVYTFLVKQCKQGRNITTTRKSSTPNFTHSTTIFSYFFSAHVYVYIYVYVYICIYIYIYTHICKYVSWIFFPSKWNHAVCAPLPHAFFF